MISIRKRGQVYQYSFEISKVDGKRKRKSKSGFKTKKEAMEAGIIEYNNYFNNGFNTRNDKISYSDYLDLWIEDYKQNMKYNTIRTYKSIIEKYLKPNLGQYRLSGITSYQLNNFIIGLCNKYDYSRDYIRNILKVLKVSFRDATDLYGFINYNPTLTIKVPTKYVKKIE